MMIMRLTICLSLCLTLFACAEGAAPSPVEGAPLEEVIQGSMPQAKADELSITLTPMPGFEPSMSVIGREGRRLITTPEAFEDHFGHQPPASIDFTQEWIIFYSAGLQSSGAHKAQILDVRLSSTGKSLQVSLIHEQPGLGCQDGKESRPWSMVKLPKQRVRPQSVRYYQQTQEAPCSATPGACIPASISADLQALGDKLWMTSEGDEPVSVEDWGQAPGLDLLDDQSLLDLLQEPNVEGVIEQTGGDAQAAAGATASLEAITLERFVQNIYRYDGAEVTELDDADRADLINGLRTTLGADVRAFKVYTHYTQAGSQHTLPQVRVYVMGSTPCGFYGLMSLLIET